VDTEAIVATLWPAVEAHLARQERCVLAVDGPDCAGKTTLADVVAARANQQRLSYCVVHLDATFEDTARRPRGNPDAVSEFLLDFFHHDGLKVIAREATEQLIVIEGMFLLRAGLLDLYDISIRLELDERTSFERAYVRDLDTFACWGDFALHHVTQCLAAQRVYRSLCSPESHASFTFAAD
jgi:uridine kinase